jgi:hypothetical protein
MKKYIGYTILCVFLGPLLLLVALLYWPIPAFVGLFNWLFDEDENMAIAGALCGIPAAIVWMCVLGFLMS